MQLKQIKNFLGWELFLFVLVHLAILFNFFSLLAIFTIVYVTFSDISIGIINPFLFLAVLLFSFVLIKYSSLPITLWVIKKWTKKEMIKNCVKTIVENYKFQTIIVLIAIILDSIIILINYKYPDLCFNTFNFWYLFFGGLTGSYLLIFTSLFAFKKFKQFKNCKNGGNQCN